MVPRWGKWAGGWFCGGVFGVVVLILLVWTVVAMIRSASGSTPRSDESPEPILKRRYARGELDREEYQRRLEDLRR
jgi:putative membrane protein